MTPWRATHLSDAIQDYLKEIYKLGSESERVSTSALARRQHVSDASASAMVKKLAALGLAEHAPYRGVTLTHAGEQVALEVIRHHRLLELYLAETLGIGVDDVHDEADRLEHALSEELEARIDKALGFPTHDPHGDPIPDANLEWPKEPSGKASLAPSEEVPLEERQHLGAGERLHLVRRAVLLEHPNVVLERVVGSFECVAELVALEDPVVPPRLVGRAVLGVDHAADRPRRARTPLDPDHDALLPARVVEAPERSLGTAALGGLGAHSLRIQSRAMALRDIFSFLFQRSPAEERVAVYVIREHERGRDLAEIMEDRYVQNRLTPQQRARLLDRPEVIKAIGEDTVEDVRAQIAT